MSETHFCIYRGIECKHANAYCDCGIGRQNCKQFEKKDLDTSYLDDYLDFDLFDEEL